MTSKQSWSLFCKYGYDLRNCVVTQEQINAMFEGTLHPKDIAGSICKREVKPKQDFAAIYNEAREAGLKAGNECTPVPMVVCEHSNPLDDNSPVVKRYAPILSGVCGFAWIVVKPATSAFAKWLKQNNLAKPHYYGGLSIWVGDFNQSMEMKEAYAHAFSEVLNKHGINSYSGSRMD